MSTEYMHGIFVTDIETVGHPDRVRFIPQPEAVTNENAPASMKKHDTREKWAVRKNTDLQSKYDEAVARMGLDVDLCQIATLAWKVQVAHSTLSAVSLGADNEEEETEILVKFWHAWMQFGSRMCGFNIVSFDLPIIMRRSWALGVRFAPIRLRRYSTEYVIDLMQEFYGWGQYPGKKYRGLKTLADMYGIPVSKKDVDGSMVATMTNEERCEYCASDVDVTWELARRLHGSYWT